VLGTGFRLFGSAVENLDAELFCQSVGNHGSAGLRKEHQLREQSPSASSRSVVRTHDLRRRYPGRGNWRLVEGRATQGNPAYSYFLQELCADGRRDAVCAMR